MKIKSGFLEIKTNQPFLRSFLVPSDLGNCRVDVYSNAKNSLYTVGTSLHHPKQGKTQLFRKHLTEKEVLEILKNPRKHTGKGYKRK